MKKGFVVQEVGYEYNDENYYRAESGGGIAKFVFFSKEKAEEKVIELVAELLKGSKGYRGKLENYQPFLLACSDNEMDFSEEQFEEFKTQLALISDDCHLPPYEEGYELAEFRLPLGLTKEQRFSLAKILSTMVVLYEVVEVEVDE